MKGCLKIAVIFLVVIITGLNSCKKEPGSGGLATIHGKVYGYDANNFGIITDSGYVAETRVYLAYGNNTWVDDDTRTSYTGEYAFPFLHTGEYTLWVINECDTCPLQQSADIVRVTVNNPRETVEVRDLINIY